GEASGSGVVASLVSLGEEQPGSAMSTRPSPSSSTPLAQAGACSSGTSVVVVAAGSSGVPSATGSAPAIPTPVADIARKPASTTIIATLLLIPVRLDPRSHGPRKRDPHPPRATGVPTLPARHMGCNGPSRPPTRP